MRSFSWKLSLLFLLWLGSAARGEEVFSQPAWAPATVSVYAVRDGEVVFSRDPDRLMVPASALKIVTAARWLDGPDFLATTVLENPDGSWVLRGGADPVLTSEDVRRLAVTSLSRSDGDALPRRLYLEVPELGDPWGPGWAWEDMASDFSPGVYGLTVDRGLYTVRVTAMDVEVDPEVPLRVRRVVTPDPLYALRVPGFAGTCIYGTGEGPLELPVLQPDLWAARLFRRSIGAHCEIVRGPADPAARVVEVHRSAPVREILREALATSDNLVFETLYRTAPRPLELEGPHRIVDGCGLSRYNLVTARQLVSVLERYPELVELLPRAGTRGTMEKRDLPGVAAKTGTMSGISALVGRLDDGTLFAILTNGSPGPMSEVKKLEERLVRELAVDLPR